MSLMGQKHELPRRSIAVRFNLNEQTLTERVQCGAMCQEETFRTAANSRLFYELVGAKEEGLRDRQSKCLGGL
jgi:hypothetical protein